MWRLTSRFGGRFVFQKTEQGEKKSVTKHHQLYLLLKDEITSSRFAPGSVLPGELKLAEQYAVSRVTVRAAIKTLADNGFVDRRPGVGTLVRDRVFESSVMHGSIADLFPTLEKMGRDSRARMLEFGYEIPPENIRNALKLQEKERTQRAVRVRLMGDTPFSYLVTHVRESVADTYDERDLARYPLFRLLEKGGVKIDSATQRISAVLSSQIMSEALHIPLGSALIHLNRVVFDDTGSGVEYLDAYYRPDLYELKVDLSRTGGKESRRWTAHLDQDR